ncbi:FAD-dependent oxidoreductase [Nocardioides humi]|uniref:FAD-binding dehydrogenase n=1 Tax=Nocardioides humi TaxID=449461 RepID=A0ABN2A7H6_9ACTN|nr:FAD-dependent oxidoreductase [Nocardioides humi]
MSADAPGRFDVAVVGAGVAGLSCAIEAATAGATVAVVDAAPEPGGTAGVAGGGTCIAGSDLQLRQGIEDSADQALEDWIAWGGDSVDVAWAERYLRDSRVELFDRLGAAGVEWVAVHAREGNRHPRWHQPAGGGARVMSLLSAHARTLPGITWLTGHRVTRLVSAGGRVTGLTADGPTGEVEVVAGRTVVASGGFNNNHAMVSELAAEAAGAERVLLGGGLGAVGEGHRMLADVGAQFSQLDAVWMFPYGTPDHRAPAGHRGLAVRGIDDDIWVNDEGNRFHDESLRSGATGTKALLAQPNGRCWSVIDARLAATMTIADPYYRNGSTPLRERIEEFLRTSPHVVSARSLDELAARMDVDRVNLRDAVGELNTAVTAGEQRERSFGKDMTGRGTVAQAPFHAIRFHPVARKNLGGVRTDLSCQVLDRSGRAIEGLYAAGEVAGMAGGRINGRAALEGTSFGPSMYSGLVAGRSVVDRSS